MSGVESGIAAPIRLCALSLKMPVGAPVASRTMVPA
jgi:hypothetical protein